MSALNGIRVVELAETVAGEYCAKILADFGAEVIKIERPRTGSPTRTMEPLKSGPGNKSCSGLFAWLNTNKRSLILDLDLPADRDSLQTLIASADVVVDDHDLDWLTTFELCPAEFERRFPSTILCSITPYGLQAPQEFWQASNLTIFHDSGWGYHTPTAADPSRPPLKGPGRFLVDYEAGTDAASTILSSLYWRNRSGLGQVIELSKRNVLVSRADLVLGRLLAGEDTATQSRTAYDQAGPSAIFPCADGSVYLYITNQKHWRGVKELLGHPEWMAEYDENWLEFGVTPQLVSRFQDGFRAWIADKHRGQVSDEGQRLGIPLVPVNTAADLHNSPQFQYREYFQSHRHPELGDIAFPTTPFRMSATPAIIATPAPALDEHRDAVFSSAPVKRHRTATTTSSPRQGPLSGLRVLEITKVWAGPYAGKLLAFLGAEVIKVESYTNMDELRAFGGVDIDHAPYFLSVNQEIKSVQANMKTDEGLDLVRHLIAHSDILINNLRPGAMERLGLGYDELVKIKPDLIALSIKMFGNDGPQGHQTGYAPSFAALGGVHHLVGYEGEQPLGTNMRYGDSSVGASSVLGALIALMHREQSGQGQLVDVSAVECMTALAGDSFVQYAMTGVSPGPDGNRHTDMAPHGTYPCLGDTWISIAITTDDEWHRFCKVLRSAELAAQPDYQDRVSRRSHAASLDEWIARLTRGEDPEALAARLRDAGLAASKSLSSLDLIADEALWREGIFRHVSDDRNGTRPVIGPGWRMSKTDYNITKGAPRLGEHNEQIYADLLGMTQDKIFQLIDDKIIF